MNKTLKDDMATDFAALVLNDSEFAEIVTYRPESGAARRVYVQATMNQSLDPGGPIDYDVETLLVRVQKDKTHAKGGIPQEEISNGAKPTIIRDNDIEVNKFVFDGTVSDETPHSWRLTFTRPKGYRTGGDSLRR